MRNFQYRLIYGSGLNQRTTLRILPEQVLSVDCVDSRFHPSTGWRVGFCVPRKPIEFSPMRPGTSIVPSKILITQLSPVRDILLALPLVVDIKRLWPQSHISWLVECDEQGLLALHPCVDDVIRIERGWLRRPSGWRKMREQIRQRQFDVVFDPQGLTKSALLGWISGAKTRIGFDSSRARELAPWLATRRIHATARHQVDVIRQLLTPWHEAISGAGDFAMPIVQVASQKVDQILQACGLSSSCHWYAIHAGAVWPTSVWPAERLGQVARHLFEEHNMRSVVLWLSENERLLAKVVAETSQGSATMVDCGDLSVAMELLRRPSFLLSGDSEMLQLASAVKTPCLSLHGPTWADEIGAYRNAGCAIQSPLPNLSKRMVRRGPNTAMQAIELEEVLYHAQRLVARLRSQNARTSAA